MAIIKHVSSKNNRYDDVFVYLKYEHERHVGRGQVWYEPKLNEYGLLQERTDCILFAMDAHGNPIPPENWAAACERTNLRHQKPSSNRRRKNHTYIISLPESDRPNATKEGLLDIAKRLAREYFKGYEVLIAVHFDEAKNPHVHLVINSIRSEERAEAPWMMRNQFGDVLPCEVIAGGMHQDSTGLRQSLNDWLLTECRRRGWSELDNNSVAEQRKNRRFQSKHTFLRNAILSLTPQCRSLEELTQELKTQYGIQLNRRGKTISLLHPQSKKAVRLSTLDLDSQTLFQNMPDFFVNSASPQLQEEEKKYVDWVISRRTRNEKQALALQEQIEALLKAKAKQKTEVYRKEDYRALYKLVSLTTSLSAALATERDKADRLLSAWDIYLDSSRSDKERHSNGRFVAWCGCDPDNSIEHQWLCEQRQNIAVEECMAVELCNQLVAESEQWKHHNELAHLERDIVWLKRREDQLKHQIKYYKKRTNKLWDISYNCEMAAMRRSPLQEGTFFIGGPPPGWESYYKFRGQWTESTLRLRELEQQLASIKQQRRSAQFQKIHHKFQL